MVPNFGESKVKSGNLLNEFSASSKNLFKKRNSVLSFQDFLDLVEKNPQQLTRNSAMYLRDVFDYFGTRSTQDDEKGGRLHPTDVAQLQRFKIFDIGTERNIPIIGGESVHKEIYNILQAFVRQGVANKLIMLHGPNGSAKTSTIECIAKGMQLYSELDEGAVYRFNWIFPTDKIVATQIRGETGPIGFAKASDHEHGMESFALLGESEITSRLVSELKENPIYLIPMPDREIWLRNWIAAQTGCSPDQVELPPHITLGGLSKRNQQIYSTLLAAYDGDASKVLRHVQVERFFYSRQYRVGIATVEPQMSMDAQEKQLTMDRNLANLPGILQNIRFYEAQGELIEANRGILEFSDLLKRPVETFKYLLSTIERGTVSLASSTALLDMVFVATSNEKHLDAFKTIPDFSSFRGRFEFIKVPYLLRPSLETKIYEPDRIAMSKSHEVLPHTIELLCTWAVMTRLKQPDPEFYDAPLRGAVVKLDPRNKVRLYERQTLNGLKPTEENTLRDLRTAIMNESLGSVVYEGRFGASPREVRQILYRAAQTATDGILTPMDVFRELELLIKDRSVYDFLQFEPRGKYHDAPLFLKMIQDEFAETFEMELLSSLTLVEENQYENLLTRYVENIVAEIKKEKIYNPKTSNYEPANQNLMNDVEKILSIASTPEKHREGVLARIASWKIENPEAKIDISTIFPDFLRRIQEHYYEEKEKVIESAQRAMLVLGSAEASSLSSQELKLAETGYSELQRRYGYSEAASRRCVKFLLKHKTSRSKQRN